MLLLIISINFLVKYLMKDLKQAKLATKADIADSITKIYFDGKLKNNKKVISNKRKHLVAERKLMFQKKNSEISTKGYYFLLVKMYFTNDGGYRIFLVFSPILNFLTLDNNHKKLVTEYQQEYLQKRLDRLILFLQQ